MRTEDPADPSRSRSGLNDARGDVERGTRRARGVRAHAADGVREAHGVRDTHGDRYKWVALSNTTLGVLMATLDSSIMLIAMPDIFRGIHLDPLQPGNSFYLLWMILSFLIVSSVLVVSLGRLGDIFGRVRMYNLGFAVYTVASLILTVDWLTGRGGALYLVGFRVVQGIGAAFLVANSAAILTDAFPPNQRGLALGINNVAGISGSFIGLVVGGLLAPIDWRLIFLVSVPFGAFGTVWAYLKLEDRGVRHREPVDWLGNVTFGLGLTLVMIGITYGIEPYQRKAMGWMNPAVLVELGAGVLLLIGFLFIETKVENPMFRLPLFKIRAFTAGTLSSFLSALGRGGLMFMLIIWLQGIWLPLHGYSFSNTPLWAGIYMLPLTAGFLLAGPISGILSDRFGARPFATGGMVCAALTFVLLERLPVNFGYPVFAAILLMNGLSMGAFASPNRAGVMNSLPAGDRGAGGGMNATFQSSAQVLSIGIFFTLMILGLSSALSTSLYHGLTVHGVPTAIASRAASLPPVSTLFAAFLGYNPVQHLIGPQGLAALSGPQRSVLLGHSFFPSLIASPFHSGLHEAFAFSIAACLIAAVASWSRGKRYVDHGSAARSADGSEEAGPPEGAPVVIDG
ncbi:MAG TPA: MFS transporter [Acidimicrobiales bacterium]|nr:MFS transporter [Acidimicrobiales bacterium]